ncbi:MAG: Hpt domain-containing protein [Synergistaceae bacterium]|nr:Hpt domain-containing protein [Synergistaceae bacterium]
MDEAEIKQYMDTEKALERIRGNKKLLKTLLTHFMNTQDQVAQLKREVKVNDKDGAAKSAHAIKGVAANLSMTALYDQSVSFEALLKSGGDTGDMAEGFGTFETAYKKTLECVEALLRNFPA